MIIKPPNPINIHNHNTLTKRRVFLAGSIEMDFATNWQEDLGQTLSSLGWIVFNPRRDNWDASWEQKSTNPQFFQQVTWELDAIEKSDLVIVYFDPATKSPITLMELGILTGLKKNVLVVCPDGFWRKGNVDILCQRYDFPQFENLVSLTMALACVDPQVRAGDTDSLVIRTEIQNEN
jgi:nucleoside 2-deoxyribosyltransferase